MGEIAHYKVRYLPLAWEAEFFLCAYVYGVLGVRAMDVKMITHVNFCVLKFRLQVPATSAEALFFGCYVAGVEGCPFCHLLVREGHPCILCCIAYISCIKIHTLLPIIQN